ncbi:MULTISPECIES: DnaD domain protein [unclassified Breznakia]|uniref:DnaD domain protein n=1 Tax=unclassified Breznakia TaxID=2623764 RepID=UPI002407090A|nr:MULTISPECIES: DnaD domain protein [unclassified Breznakia]MDF9838705.1 replication initiation and membrane attachment protein [Breznakia sp. PFB2-8]MDF9860736.1 replication initiation and membrane attachment protein [Breznakia sp. PH5-24]
MLKVEDKVRVEIHGVINEESHSILTMLYYPLIKDRAYILYQLLIALSTKRSKFENHLILHELSGFSMEVIEQERKTLEKYQLLKTYYDPQKKQYLYAIIPPKSGSDFLEHEVFGRLYLNRLGEQVVKFQKINFLANTVDKTRFNDISECISDVLKDDWNEAFEKTYLEVKNEIQNSKQKQTIAFNYDELLKDLSDIIWPRKNRSEKQLEEIGQIATVYGISPKQMKILISRSVDKRKNSKTYGKLDIKALREKAASSKAKFETEEVNIYKWPPIRFLQNKQNGVPVSKHDAETIRILLEEYRLIPEVCNVLIEYVLNTSEQKFIRNYVESIASSWVRAKIDTYEKALVRIHGSEKKKSSTTESKKVEKDTVMSEEERSKLLEEINAMKGKLSDGEV